MKSKLSSQLVLALVCVISFSCGFTTFAIDAAYVHIIKNDLDDTRFHLGEVEAFASLAAPDELGGAEFGGLSTSTNDIGDGALTTFGDGNIHPVIGTTTALEHGGANTNPNNALELAGAVWSTANSIGSNAQYTLDLGGTFDVTTVRLWPRADNCCGARFQNLEIQLLDAAQNPIAGTLTLHQTGGPDSNTPLEIEFVAGSAEIERVELDPAVTFPTPADAVVLSSAADGTVIGDLLAFTSTEGGNLIPNAEYSLIAGTGDTDNVSYAIGGVNDQQLLLDASLDGLDDVTHSVRVFAEAGATFEQIITFTVKADSDMDGLIDDWETMFGVLGDFESGEDKDADGLNDEDEFLLGTDPSDDDSDDDGSKDGDEIANMTDPKDDDSDDDGLKDGDEATLGSDPLNPDSDADTILDGEEAILGVDGFITDPTKADTDGDGAADNLEIALGTDPTDPTSKPNVPAGSGRFIEVVKNDLDDTRFHLAEIEIFGPGVEPNGVGGGNAGLSTNDLIDTIPLGATRYLGVGTPTTTTDLEHGGGSSQTDNTVETAGAVWSTANGLLEEARYVLDLGQSVNIDKVRLWARGDGCCTQRFENLTINLYADNGAGDPGLLVSTVEFPDLGPSGNTGPLEVSMAGGKIDNTPDRITSIVPVTVVGGKITQFEITWDSDPEHTYALKYSSDMTDWGNDVDDSILSDGDSTTYPFDNPIPDASRIFFRIEDVTTPP